MAFRIQSMIWEAFPGGGSDLLTMLALADWSDDNGQCYPSMNAIAKKVRLSKSQAQRVVHGLIDGGFLVITANALGGLPGQTRNYKIVLDHLTGSARATGRINATGRPHAAEGSHPHGERGSAHATQTVSEPSITVNRKRETKHESRFDAKSFLIGQGVPEQVAADWLELRKAKKAAPTQTAIEGIQRETAKAGITLSEALATCCTRGWLGFKAEWVSPAEKKVAASVHEKRHQPGDTRTRKGVTEVFDEGAGWIPK